MAFIDAMRAEHHAVESVCRVLREQGCQVAARTYRAWKRSQPSARDLADAYLMDAIWELFHVFDRATLRHLGSFRGDSTLNTDGIALTQRGFGSFPNGAFYAIHNDGNVAAFSWDAIADALRLRKDCVNPAGTAEPAS